MELVLVSILHFLVQLFPCIQLLGYLLFLPLLVLNLKQLFGVVLDETERRQGSLFYLVQVKFLLHLNFIFVFLERLLDLHEFRLSPRVDPLVVVSLDLKD